jgi:hypothetical protein
MRGDKSTYENGRIRVLAASLAEAGICGETAARILEEGDKIGRSSTPESKAEWMAEAMRRMDTLLDEPTRRAVRERCACSLGGKRLQMSRSIARDHESLEERIGAANDARFVFGHSVSLTENGEVLVCFAPEGQPQYRCVCLPKAKEPISTTYCYCCGGHVKHHLQTALGRKVDVTVRSSALASGGTQPCSFLFRFTG